jgi:putative transposase
MRCAWPRCTRRSGASRRRWPGSKENLVSTLPPAECRALVEREAATLPLAVQADLLGISRSSLYYRPRQPTAEEVALKLRIDAIYTSHPFCGSRRVSAQLQREERTGNRKAVQRHMCAMGIAGICPGPNLSRRAQGEQVYPYLLRTISCSYSNQVWGIDVTDSRLRTSWMYLVAVLDWFSRYVISWELDDTLQRPFVLGAVQRALAQAKPVIWNSAKAAISPARSIATRCWPRMSRSAWTAKAKRSITSTPSRLWRSLKYEEVYPNDYAAPREARGRVTLSRLLQSRAAAPGTQLSGAGRGVLPVLVRQARRPRGTCRVKECPHGRRAQARHHSVR